MQKRLFLAALAIFLVIFIDAQTQALDIGLQWDPNSEDDLAGYKVYYGLEPISLTTGTEALEGASPIDVSLFTTATISGLDPNKNYCFAVTAYNTSNIESAYSNIVWVFANLPTPSFTISQPNGNGTNPTCIEITDTNPSDDTQYLVYYGAPPPIGTVRVCDDNTITACVPSTFLQGTNVVEGISPIITSSKSFCFNTTGTTATNSVAVTAFRPTNDNFCSTNYKCESGMSNVEEYSISPAVPLWMIQTAAGANGTVTSTVAISQGGSQTIEITPSTCYKPNVTVDGVPVGSPLTWSFNNVMENHILNATFVPQVFWVYATAGTGGTISPVGYNIVSCGTSPTYSITPNDGYHIATVLLDGVAIEAPYELPAVTANHTLNATFAINTYPLTIAKSGTGTGVVSSSPSGISCGTTCSGTYAHGTSVTLTATPDTGSTFTGWTGACTGTGTCTVSMTEAKSVGAGFALTPTNTILFQGINGDLVFWSTDINKNYITGSAKLLSIVPAAGYGAKGYHQNTDGSGVILFQGINGDLVFWSTDINKNYITGSAKLLSIVPAAGYGAKSVSN